MWEPYEVKAQTIKTAVESATLLLLRIDDIVSGLSKRDKLAPGQSNKAPQAEDPDAVRLLWLIFQVLAAVWRQDGPTDAIGQAGRWDPGHHLHAGPSSSWFMSMLLQSSTRHAACDIRSSRLGVVAPLGQDSA